MKRQQTLGRWLMILAFCLAPMQIRAQQDAAPAPGFDVVLAKSHLADAVVRLNATFDLRLGPRLIEALENGVPLDLLIEIEVIKESDYLWSTTAAALEQRYRIAYRPLTKDYLYTNLNSGAEFQFPTLPALLGVLSSLKDFPLIDAGLLDRETHYRGDIRISLERQSLPVPLRLMSYVTADWYLASEWYSWPLLP